MTISLAFNVAEVVVTVGVPDVVHEAALAPLLRVVALS